MHEILPISLAVDGLDRKEIRAISGDGWPFAAMEV
jgi:hypothetical protein